jgi:hypothetical protein
MLAQPRSNLKDAITIRIMRHAITLVNDIDPLEQDLLILLVKDPVTIDAKLA